MASSSTRIPKKPSFFKIILAKTIEDGKIAIPKKFVHDYGDSLSCPVSLQDPFNETWKVKLTNNDGNLWLDEGWREFVDHYSIEQGYFVTFKYRGNSQFRITIFDSTSLEIAYPGIAANAPYDEELENYSKFLSEDSETESESGIFEIPNVVTAPSRKRKQQTTQPQTMSKKIKNVTTGDSDKTLAMPNEGEDGKVLTLEFVQPKVMRRIKKLLKKTEHKAVKEAMGFETENPFFLVMMYPTYIDEPKQVCVPLPFAEKYFPGTEGKIILEVSDGRTWPLKYKVYTGLRRCQMTSGWRQFVWDNKLHLNDLLFSEKLEEEDELSENIQQTPLMKTEPIDLDHDKLASPEALKAARLFESEFPFFHVVITPSFVQGETMDIPKYFNKKHLSIALKTVKLEAANLSWPVKLVLTEGRVRQFSDGWSAFVNKNHLHVGDVCVFEMIRKRPTKLKMTTFR